MVLGEIQVTLYLKGGDKNTGDHKKESERYW